MTYKSKLSSCLNCPKLTFNKFCGYKCRTRYYARKRYNKLKHDPKFRKANVVRSSKWIKENYEHFKDLVREPNRIRTAKLLKFRHENHLCIYCNVKLNDDYKKKSCEHCLEIRRVKSK